jgi:hypothetical protein
MLRSVDPPPLPRSTLLSTRSVQLSPAAERALFQDIDSQAEALLSTAPILPGDRHVVVRADGGLWVVVGHDGLWVIFGVRPGDWAPA